MINFLPIGIVLGLSGGLTPGPLLALVISETLQHGIKSGLKVAVVPIITDLPIIILALLVFARLSDFNNVLGLISIFGGFFVLFLGFNCLRTRGVELNLKKKIPKSLTKGILVNVLSPHPYLFWLSIGAPITNKALNQSIFAALAFVGSFYFMLVGSKIFLAVLVNRFKHFMSGSVYIYTMRLLGLILCVLAIVLLHDGFKLLQMVAVKN
ncbi:MAG: LysE family transporter [Candidatus Theseobacter exili]|nr:LysE family transporter [Candidatus Theseobacter exili]